MNDVAVPMKYVAYCDVLGFSSAVLNDFDAAVAVYQNFRQYVRQWPFSSPARVSVYSDSILVVAEQLPAILHTVVSLQWAALLNDWLIRGGIGYGRHWEESEDGNLFVVSDALVRATKIEKSIKVPAVVVSPEIPLGIEAWIPRFEHGVHRAPLLYFQGLTLVNPFNAYWFASAKMRAERLLTLHPNHKDKYEWFLSLASAVARDDVLVPEVALARMLEMGILHDRMAFQADSPPKSDDG